MMRDGEEKRKRRMMMAKKKTETMTTGTHTKLVQGGCPNHKNKMSPRSNRSMFLLFLYHLKVFLVLHSSKLSSHLLSSPLEPRCLLNNTRCYFGKTEGGTLVTGEISPFNINSGGFLIIFYNLTRK